MSDTARTLSMKFDTNLGKTATVSIQHCRDGITEEDAKSVMDSLIAAPILTDNLTGKISAQIAERKLTTLF
jgi:flagellar motor switch protein FliM